MINRSQPGVGDDHDRKRERMDNVFQEDPLPIVPADRADDPAAPFGDKDVETARQRGEIGGDFFERDRPAFELCG